jgi:hypothetical protein
LYDSLPFRKKVFALRAATVAPDAAFLVPLHDADQDSERGGEVHELSHLVISGKRVVFRFDEDQWDADVARVSW